ncbi:MAG TPA: MCE family protein [Streptosporangiaceae bacterium]
MSEKPDIVPFDPPPEEPDERDVDKVVRAATRRKSIVPPLIYSIIFIVVTVLATAVLGVSIANVGLGTTASYNARFSDVTGLNEGDDVRIAGVRVGQVESIKVVDRRVAQVGFSVEAGRVLPRSVTAAIRYRNMVGQRYVQLARGVGPVGAVLPRGGTIPLAQTTPPLDLTDLFNGFQPLFKALSPNEVNSLANEIVQVFQGEGATMGSLLSNTASLTNTLADKDRVIGRLITNLNSVLRTINSRGGKLASMVTTLQRLVTGLAGDRKPIGSAITAISGLTNSTAGLLHDARPPLKSDISGLSRLAGNLDDNSGTVETFLQRLPTKMTRIATTASYGSWLNFYLCSASVTGLTYQHVEPPPSPAPPTPGISLTENRCRS